VDEFSLPGPLPTRLHPKNMQNDEGKVTVVVRRKCVVAALVSFVFFILSAVILSRLRSGKPFEVEEETLRVIAWCIVGLNSVGFLTTILFWIFEKPARVEMRFLAKGDPRNIH
jgi:hypothetical protein